LWTRKVNYYFLIGKLERLKRVKPKPKKLRRKRKIKKAAEVEVDENGAPVVRAEGAEGEAKEDGEGEDEEPKGEDEEAKGDADPEEPKVEGDALDEEEGKFFWGWSKTIY
jgi:hypothetical protein